MWPKGLDAARMTLRSNWRKLLQDGKVKKGELFKPFRGMKSQKFMAIVEEVKLHLAKVDGDQSSNLCYKEIALYLAWQGVSDVNIIQTLKVEDTDSLVSKPLLRITLSRILRVEMPSMKPD